MTATKHYVIDKQYQCNDCHRRETFPVVPYMPSGQAVCVCGGRMPLAGSRKGWR